jgi:hypothetical protein
MSEENPGNGSLYDEDEAFHDDLDNSLEHGENTFVEIPGLDSQLLQQAWERLTETNKEQRFQTKTHALSISKDLNDEEIPEPHYSIFFTPLAISTSHCSLPDFELTLVKREDGKLTVIQSINDLTHPPMTAGEVNVALKAISTGEQIPRQLEEEPDEVGSIVKNIQEQVD